MGGEERRAKSLRNGVHVWRTRSRGDQCEENAPEATPDSTPHATTPSSGSDGGASEGVDQAADAMKNKPRGAVSFRYRQGHWSRDGLLWIVGLSLSSPLQLTKVVLPSILS